MPSSEIDQSRCYWPQCISIFSVRYFGLPLGTCNYKLTSIGKRDRGLLWRVVTATSRWTSHGNVEQKLLHVGNKVDNGRGIATFNSDRNVNQETSSCLHSTISKCSCCKMYIIIYINFLNTDCFSNSCIAIDTMLYVKAISEIVNVVIAHLYVHQCEYLQLMCHEKPNIIWNKLHW